MCDLLKCNDASTANPLPKVSDADRRGFLAGMAALPLATVLAYPDLAQAAASGLSDVSIDTKSGGKATGVIAMPEKLPAPAVLLIHEWWGLNDQIKAVAADLYGGKVATTRDDARSYMKAVDGKQATEQVAAGVEWLRSHKQGTGKVGTIGWCFGEGWKEGFDGALVCRTARVWQPDECPLRRGGCRARLDANIGVLPEEFAVGSDYHPNILILGFPWRAKRVWSIRAHDST